MSEWLPIALTVAAGILLLWAFLALLDIWSDDDHG